MHLPWQSYPVQGASSFCTRCSPQGTWHLLPAEQRRQPRPDRALGRAGVWGKVSRGRFEIWAPIQHSQPTWSSSASLTQHPDSWHPASGHCPVLGTALAHLASRLAAPGASPGLLSLSDDMGHSDGCRQPCAPCPGHSPALPARLAGHGPGSLGRGMDLSHPELDLLPLGISQAGVLVNAGSSAAWGELRALTRARARVGLHRTPSPMPPCPRHSVPAPSDHQFCCFGLGLIPLPPGARASPAGSLQLWLEHVPSAAQGPF